MRRRAPNYVPNIRATSTETTFYVDSTAPLVEWLIEHKAMEKAEASDVGRHWYVLYGEGMELIVDPPTAMSGAQVKCYGRNKKELAAWILEFAKQWEDGE